MSMGSVQMALDEASVLVALIRTSLMSSLKYSVVISVIISSISSIHDSMVPDISGSGDGCHCVAASLSHVTGVVSGDKL